MSEKGNGNGKKSDKDKGKVPPTPADLPAIVKVGVPLEFNGYRLRADLEHARNDTQNMDSFIKRTLPKIDVNPPFQRQECWSPRQAALFISECFSATIPIPTMFVAKKSNRANETFFWGLDCKQRVTSFRAFLAGQVRIPVEIERADGSKTIKKMNWTQMNESEECETLVNQFLLKPLSVVTFDNCELEDMVAIFSALNSGTPLNKNEQCYCNYFRARLLFDHCFDVIFTPILPLMPVGIANKVRFNHNRAVHELLLLCCDADLRGSPEPRGIRHKDRMHSARVIHKELREMKFDGSVVGKEVLEAFKLDTTLPTLASLVAIMNDVYTHHTDIGRGPQCVGPITPTGLADPVAVLYKAVKSRRVTLKSLKAMRFEIAAALKGYEAEKHGKKLNQTTSDKPKIAQKFALMEEFFVSEGVLPKPKAKAA